MHRVLRFALLQLGGNTTHAQDKAQQSTAKYFQRMYLCECDLISLSLILHWV